MRKSTKAYAKINLYLDVTGRRPDGYHEILSIMQQVTLHDTVSVEICASETDEREISISCDDPQIPTDRRNIVWKCADEFFRYFKIGGVRTEIEIEKKIPQSGGLAGGSSDGAAVLKLLNELCGTNASEEELCKIGVKVGADIPFCIVGGSCVCRGIGEKLEKLHIPQPQYHVLIAASSEGVSTAKAYEMIDGIKETTRGSFDNVILSLREGRIPQNLYNKFEQVILPIHPSAANIRAEILSLGADSALMSGSGPSVFGLFLNEKSRNEAVLKLIKKGIKAYSCEVLG